MAPEETEKKDVAQGKKQEPAVDFSKYIEDINDEYDFDAEPAVEPAPPEQRTKRAMNPAIPFFKKTLRNSFMMMIAGAVAAAVGAYAIASGGLMMAVAVFIAAVGLILLGIGMSSANKTKKQIHNAQVEFAQDRAMRIYLACAEAGVESSATDDDKARILQIAIEFGFDLRDEAVGLYNTGRKLTMQGKKPDPEFDSIR